MGAQKFSDNREGRAQIVGNVTRCVIKIGSQLLVQNNDLNHDFIEKIAKQIHEIKALGIDCLVVTSGAVGCGVRALGKQHKPKTLPEKQAAAAIGQSRLMHAYDKIFSKYGLLTAQILITQEDFRDRTRYLNASHTLTSLLKSGVVPIINENDTVSVYQIRFGDNDTLSALVTNLVQADLLVILSTIDGLMDMRTKTLISEVKCIDKSIESLVVSDMTDLGSGGMGSKIAAAKIVNKAGEIMVIASGELPRVVSRILDGEAIGTVFLPPERRLRLRKRWIAFVGHAKGDIAVDAGAMKAIIEGGKSLLSSGIVSVTGDFSVGDVVTVSSDRAIFARGLVNYSAQEVHHIQGKKTGEIRSVLGYKTYDEVIHRGNLVIV